MLLIKLNSYSLNGTTKQTHCCERKGKVQKHWYILNCVWQCFHIYFILQRKLTCRLHDISELYSLSWFEICVWNLLQELQPPNQLCQLQLPEWKLRFILVMTKTTNCNLDLYTRCRVSVANWVPINSLLPPISSFVWSYIYK